MPETKHTLPTAPGTLDELATAGATQDELIAVIRYRSEQKNRADQGKLATPPAQPAPHWAARKAWLLDGQAIHGDLKEFFWPAFLALQADDQVAYSQQRDLLFKALRTFLGDPPPPVEAQP